jgi:hypothetical protein
MIITLIITLITDHQPDDHSRALDDGPHHRFC